MAVNPNISIYETLIIGLKDVSLMRGERVLIDTLNLSLSPGDLIYVTGENGIGKTTLLLALAGLLRPETGDITYHQGGFDLKALDCASLMVQPDGASRGLTAVEDLSFFLKLNRSSQNLDSLLERVGLSEARDVVTEGLSLGQRKRLSLAKIIAAQRPLWLLDEPFSALDAEGRHFVADTIKSHLDRGGICVIATHHPTTISGYVSKTLYLEATT